jgi:hypothetical protein
MAKKGTLGENIIETLDNLGKNTAKNSVDALKKSFNPLTQVETNRPSHLSSTASNQERLEKKNNYTQLNVDKLASQYQDQEQQQLALERQRLFKLVKAEEERLKKQNQQQELVVKQREQQEKQTKERKSNSQPPLFNPKGKERMSVFGRRRKKTNFQLEQSVEYRQNAGK